MDLNVSRRTDKVRWRLRTITCAESLDRYGRAGRAWLHVELLSLPRDSTGPVSGMHPVRRRHWFAGARRVRWNCRKHGSGVSFIEFVNRRECPGKIRGTPNRGVMINTRYFYLVLLGRGASRVRWGGRSKT
jgi:hypothetical protein